MSDSQSSPRQDEREGPRMPLSDQIRIAGEMAHPSIRGLAEMMLTEWKPEAERLEVRLAKAMALVRELGELLSAAEMDDDEDEAQVIEALERADRFLGLGAHSA